MASTPLAFDVKWRASTGTRLERNDERVRGSGERVRTPALLLRGWNQVPYRSETAAYPGAHLSDRGRVKTGHFSHNERLVDASKGVNGPRSFHHLSRSNENSRLSKQPQS